MDDKNKLVVFQDKKIRRIWHNEEWYFSVIDVVEVLTDSNNARNYWSMLKKRELESGIELSTNCVQLKLPSSDGKSYLTDCANTKTLFRIIQSIPSKKAEPLKMWLARVGNERIDETYDPELAIDRAILSYLNKGYSKEWVNQRLKTIEVRKELTQEWKRVGIGRPTDYAILTNEIVKAWSGKTVKEYKSFKGLRKENLRDNMSNMELVLNLLAEVTTKEISEAENPSNFDESCDIAKEGGETAKVAKDRVEKRIRKSVVSDKDASYFHLNKKLK
jgi:hypothetical protein